MANQAYKVIIFSNIASMRCWKCTMVKTHLFLRKDFSFHAIDPSVVQKPFHHLYYYYNIFEILFQLLSLVVYIFLSLLLWDWHKYGGVGSTRKWLPYCWPPAEAARRRPTPIAYKRVSPRAELLQQGWSFPNVNWAFDITIKNIEAMKNKSGMKTIKKAQK